MRDINELRREKDETLFKTAKQRIENCPILSEIYNDEFLLEIVHRRNDYDNVLFTWLVADDQCAVNFFQKIEENLKLLSEANVKKFKEKLRQWNTESFESTITEIEFAAEFARKGFQIEVDPILPNGRKGDFCISKGSLKIFFEVKIVFSPRSHEEELISLELDDKYNALNTRFVIGFDIKKDFQRSHVSKVMRHIENKLKYIERSASTLPQSFAYPDTGNPIVEIDVKAFLPEGEKGYIAGGLLGGGIRGNWNDLRRKISSGVNQLHPDYPGIIVVRPYRLATTKYDIENALFGDLKVSMLPGKSLPFRGGHRIFGKNKNERLSAVAFCQKGLQTSGSISEIIIYHNPYAKTKLPHELFGGKNVTQYFLD
jgi:hypothetical protein